MNQSGDQSETLAMEIIAHYSQGVERDRLFQNRSRLERERTQEILRRHLPSSPATILDVGGGPGVYACWLASLGYEVHLVDAVPLHIEQARQASQEKPDYHLASIRLGDARSLDRANASADAVLLLGPLYHLTEREDRLRCLREARRVVRPDGVVFAVGISRFASLFDGLASNFLDDPEYERIVEQDLANGQHRTAPDRPYFTTAFFHHPDELRLEVQEAGLAVEEVVGIEGPGYWIVRDFDAWWSDPARHERLLGAARAVEHEPSLIGLSAHIMVVARRTQAPGHRDG